MAVGATEEGEMKLVTEGDRTEIGDFDRNFFGEVTAGTLTQAKNSATFVTLAARFPLLHLRHGDRRIFLGNLVDAVVADSTVLAKLVQVGVVGKRQSPDGLRLNGGTPVVHPIQTYGDKKHQQCCYY